MRILFLTQSIFLSSLIVLGLFGCATVPPAPPTLSTESIAPEKESTQAQSTPTTLQHWKLNAQVAVRDTAANKSETANLVWQQNQLQYTLSLFGPMGTHSVKLTGKPGSVVLEKSTGEKIQAHSPEMILKEQTGYQLPVSNLYYWARGLPLPDQPKKTIFNDKNQLSELIQSEWRIQYLDYTSVNHMLLPTKIFLYHPPFSIKIIISQWDITY